MIKLSQDPSVFERFHGSMNSGKGGGRLSDQARDGDFKTILVDSPYCPELH